MIEGEENQRPLRILYHHRTASQDGQAVHIQAIIDSFIAQGHQVRVIGPSLRAKEFGESNGQISILRTHFPSALLEFLELIYSTVAFLKLLWAYITFRPDFLYERANLFLLSGVWLKAITGIHYCLEVNAPLAEERQKHGTLSLTGLAGWSEKLCWRRADTLLPVSDVLTRKIKEATPLKGRVVICHNAIHIEDYENTRDSQQPATDIPTDKIIVGFTGFVRDWHGLDQIIHWLADSVHKNQLHLLIVGDGPAAPSLKSLANQRGVADHLTITGITARADIPLFLAQMDIAVQPAVTSYASPLKLFEYMAAHKAIIAPKQDNIEEILEHGKNALLFTPDNKEDLTRNLDLLVNDPELRSRLGQAARQQIDLGHHHWSDNAKRIIAAVRNQL